MKKLASVLAVGKGDMAKTSPGFGSRSSHRRVSSDKGRFTALVVAVALVALFALPLAAQEYTPPPPPPPATAPAPPPTAPGPPLTPAQLDHVVARIALYPDPLLAQIFAAASYWEQIPEAAAWANLHSRLTGNALADAIREDNLQWDPSVLALVPFPSVLNMMAQDPAWTQELGSAVLTDRSSDGCHSAAAPGGLPVPLPGTDSLLQRGRLGGLS